MAVREYTVQNSTLKEQSYSYTYDGEGRLTGMQAGGQSLAYAYDALGRVTSETSSVLTKSYAYRTVNGRTCDLVSTLSYTKANGTSLLSLSYTYDAAGNIQTVSKSGTVYDQYAYDELGQLIREDNKDANKSYTYTYDSRGNILEKKTYAFTLGTLGTAQKTDSYGYATDSWKDRLTSYNGSTITYDAIGNPLTYNNGSAYAFTWEGRQMQTATKGNTTWTYTYNADGLRIGKTNGTTTYTYTWNDGKLTSQTWGNSYMLFYYNAEGKPLYVEYHDANDECSGTYYYVLNLQGDTVALYDPARNITAVNYEYDAWGRELSWSTYDSGYAGLIFNNPLTYRGYIYDRETGFYYLQSRYYDPTVGRFINADEAICSTAIEEGIQNNLYAYCQNSCINYIDPSGYFRIKTWIVSTSLDVLFALLNHAMMLGYISLSGAIWLLARSPFTKKLAINLVKKKIIPVFVRGFYNTALTCLRKVLQTFGAIGKEFVKGWSADKATNFINKYIDTRFYDFLSSMSTWGGIIGLVFDMLDGKWDGYITI